jgi:NADH:ubiquinone oxidoreductase subunit 6 (subunit J)
MKKILRVTAVILAAIFTLPAASFALMLLLLALAVGVFGLIFGLINTFQKSEPTPDNYQPEKDLGI